VEPHINVGFVYMHNSFHWPRNIMELCPVIKFIKLSAKDILLHIFKENEDQ